VNQLKVNLKKKKARFLTKQTLMDEIKKKKKTTTKIVQQNSN
jgi:hypothetical protein